MRIIFLGTPEFAVPTLEKLIEWSGGDIVAVVTQPNRPAGRGKNIFAPPTKVVASAHDIPVWQPERLSQAPDVVQAMRDVKPDVLITAAFGQILKQEVISLAPMGVINLHGSLLPKYRGAAPINWAIINGEIETGNTTMLTDVGVDTGGMLLKQKVPIGADTNAEDLGHTMAITGASLILETLAQLSRGAIKPIAQDDSQATHAPRLTKELGILDFSKSAADLHNLVRGLYPWPGTTTQAKGTPLKITWTRTILSDKPDKGTTPGTIILDGHRVLVTCGAQGEELLELVEVQPANKSKMNASDWVNGARITSGEVLGSR